MAAAESRYARKSTRLIKPPHHIVIIYTYVLSPNNLLSACSRHLERERENTVPYLTFISLRSKERARAALLFLLLSPVEFFFDTTSLLSPSKYTERELSYIQRLGHPSGTYTPQ